MFFYFIYFTWRLTTLQYCSGFCYTLTWISHGCTCVPHPESPPTSLPIAALRVVRVHLPWAPCLMHWTWTGDLFHIWQYTCFTIIFSQIIPPLPSPTESKNLFFTSGSFAVSHMGSSFHLSKFHIYALLYCIGVFLPGFSPGWSRVFEGEMASATI